MSPADPNTPGDSNPAANPAGNAVGLSGRSAAQGRTGTRTFTVLIISTLLVVVILFALFGLNALMRKANAPNGGPATGAAAAMHATDTPSPKQNPPGSPGGT